MLFLQEDAIAKVRELQSTYFSNKEKWCNLTYKKGQAQQRAQIGHQRESIPPCSCCHNVDMWKKQEPMYRVLPVASIPWRRVQACKDGCRPRREHERAEITSCWLGCIGWLVTTNGMPSEQQQLDTCGGPGKPDPTHIVDFHKKEYIDFLKGELSMLPVPRVSPSSRMHMDENVNPNNA
jgi:hypothetical protein